MVGHFSFLPPYPSPPKVNLQFRLFSFCFQTVNGTASVMEPEPPFLAGAGAVKKEMTPVKKEMTQAPALTSTGT